MIHGLPPHYPFKFLGITSIAIACLAGLLLVKFWPQGKGRSLSQHASSHRAAYLLFAGVLTFDGALFFVFMWQWFAPTVGLPAGFVYLMLLAYAFQVATAWVPDRSDISLATTLHRLTAFGMAFAMRLLALWIVLAPSITVFTRVVAVAVFLWMMATWYIFVLVQKSHRHFLAYQSSYIVAFYILVMLATYVR